MTKRFIWNFEINQGSFHFSEPMVEDNNQNFHWEARFFWPEEKIIILNNLNDSFLDITAYTIKNRRDFYFLLPGIEGNLKLRRDQYLYKPLISKHNDLRAFGSKINLMTVNEKEHLPGLENYSVKEILSQLQNSKPIEVLKEALIYTFPTKPKTKIELARIKINKQIYYSLSLESRNFRFVESLQHSLLKDAVSCDYVTFLKTLKNHG